MSDWRNQAACAGATITRDADPFFPADLNGKPGQKIPGLGYCGKDGPNPCPVITQCAAYALTVPLLHGVWAGVYVPNSSQKRGRATAFSKLRKTAAGKVA